jgi:hypothetical protein
LVSTVGYESSSFYLLVKAELSPPYLQEIEMTKTEILVRDGRVEVSAYASTDSSHTQELGTILSNLAYYGYTVSAEVYEALAAQAKDTLADWWGNLGSLVLIFLWKSSSCTRTSLRKSCPWTMQIIGAVRS